MRKIDNLIREAKECPEGVRIAQSFDHGVGVRAVAHDVTEDPKLVEGSDGFEHGLEGGQVGVDVREDGEAHRREGSRTRPATSHDTVRPAGNETPDLNAGGVSGACVHRRDAGSWPAWIAPWAR